MSATFLFPPAIHPHGLPSSCQNKQENTWKPQRRVHFQFNWVLDTGSVGLESRCTVPWGPRLFPGSIQVHPAHPASSLWVIACRPGASRCLCSNCSKPGPVHFLPPVSSAEQLATFEAGPVITLYFTVVMGTSYRLALSCSLHGRRGPCTALLSHPPAACRAAALPSVPGCFLLHQAQLVVSFQVYPT